MITAGQDTSATFLITDLYYNVTNVAQNPINITTNDLFDTDPGAFAITGGSLTVSTFNFRTARAGTPRSLISDSDASAPSLTQHKFFRLHDCALRRRRGLQLVLPGETPQPEQRIELTRGVSELRLGAGNRASIFPHSSSHHRHAVEFDHLVGRGAIDVVT